MKKQTYEQYLYEKGLSDSTVKHYHKHTLDFIAWLDTQGIPAEEAGSTDITAYLQHLKKRALANLTRSYHLHALKHFFNYQLSHGRRQNNPTAHIKIRGTRAKKLYPLFSKEELEGLYQKYEVPIDTDTRKSRNWFNHYRLSKQRNKTILGLMIWQGLTTPEINKLTVTDVKLREGTIDIAGSKKSAQRTLELKPHQIMELLEYALQVRPELQSLLKEKSELFYLPVPAAGKKTGSGNNGVNIWKRLTQELQKQNARFINFKQIRSAVITHWLSQHNLRQVQYMAGHKYVSTTEAYLVNQVEDLQKDIEQYHPIG